MDQASMDSLVAAFTAGAVIVIAGITGAAIVAAGPRIATWGYKNVLRWFR